MSITGILGIAAGVSLLALAGMGWLLKNSYEANGKLEIKLANAQAIIKQKEADAAFSADIVSKQADALTRLKTKVVTVVERVYAAPVTRECAASPSMRAATGGVRDIILAPALPPPAGRQPAPALR